MIKSMTGFGSASVQKKGYCVFSQVSSVNRGHLDIDISFNGKEYLFLLPEIRELVKKTVKRGKVNIHLHIEPLDQSKTVVFNENLARTILKKLRQWEKDSFSSASLRASDILHHEGVLTIKTSQAKTSVLKQLTSISLKKSLSEMDRLRLQEGR
ncbi:MAG: hypothetical protein JW928_04900, partial [Candidatus Aureabacteria bacterium]|nr:hypothetical protein [Candidatus Auribacterota bacterium]